MMCAIDQPLRNHLPRYEFAYLHPFVVVVFLVVQVIIQFLQGMIRHVVSGRSACLVDRIDELVKHLKVVDVVIGWNDQDLCLPQCVLLKGFCAMVGSWLLEQLHSNPFSQMKPRTCAIFLAKILLFECRFTQLTLFLSQFFLLLTVRLAQLSGLLQFAKNVGKNHGRVLRRFTDIRDFLATQRIGSTAGILFGILERRGNPFFGIGEDRPDVFVGRIALNIVVEAGA